VESLGDDSDVFEGTRYFLTTPFSQDEETAAPSPDRFLDQTATPSDFLSLRPIQATKAYFFPDDRMLACSRTGGFFLGPPLPLKKLVPHGEEEDESRYPLAGEVEPFGKTEKASFATPLSFGSQTGEVPDPEQPSPYDGIGMASLIFSARL